MSIILDGADKAASRTSLGLSIGTDVLAPNGSAASLTNVPADQLTGTVPAGSLSSATIPASQLSGVVPTANLGSGTADATTFLRGDGAYSAISAGGTHELIGTASASSSSILEVTGLTTSFDSFRLIATELTVSVTSSDTGIVVHYGTSAGYVNDTQYEGTETIWEAGNLTDHISTGQGFMVSNSLIRGGIDNGFFTFDYLLQRSINKWGPNLVGNYICRRPNNTTKGGILIQSHRNVNDNAGNTMTKVKVFPTQGTFTSGRFSVYGVKHA
jgi:hypothetical protein|tara:strand:- start:2136 stop:2948 length:813 start_codon:yes stop_codon:yes gene_type:complete